MLCCKCIFGQIKANLVEIQPKNHQNAFFFAKSKHAWVQPVKNKTGQVITDAFEKILKGTERRKLINLQTDDGKEFYNKTL